MKILGMTILYLPLSPRTKMIMIVSLTILIILTWPSPRHGAQSLALAVTLTRTMTLDACVRLCCNTVTPLMECKWCLESILTISYAKP